MLRFYRAIWHVTGRRQLLLIGLSLLVAAIAAAPLKFQQDIINNLVADGDKALLVALCSGFLGVVALSAGLKFALNFSVAAVGESVIRLIRGRVYERVVTDTRDQNAPSMHRGTLVTMVSAEAEGVGAFAGSAFAAPLVQVGTLMSVVAFITANQPQLGLIALAVIVPQAIIVVAIQARINAKVRERTRLLRDATDRVSMSDLRRVEAEVVADFDAILVTRRQTFALKLSVKFLLSVISACGTAGVLLLGGWLVIDGRADAGIVVASLTGLTRLEGPWRELIAFYRQASAMRVGYDMIVAQFTDAAASR